MNGSGMWAASGMLGTSTGRWSPALGDTLRAGHPAKHTPTGQPVTSTAVETPSPARPEHAMSTSTFLARMRLERALMALARRTAGRTPTRDERRLSEHYTRQLRALDNDEGPS